jgi:RimJ/RimL family protein N-acetyltransferase
MISFQKGQGKLITSAKVSGANLGRGITSESYSHKGILVLTLKKAQPDDAKFVYDLRFSTDVIQASLSSMTPTFEEHLNWWNKKVNTGNHHLLLAFDGDNKIGYLRYDITELNAEVSIALDPSLRGKGIGRQILQLGEEWLKENTDVTRIGAKVLQNNSKSLQMFKSQSFEEKFIQLEKVIK